MSNMNADAQKTILYSMNEINGNIFGNIRKEASLDKEPYKTMYENMKESIKSKGMTNPIIIKPLDPENQDQEALIDKGIKYGIIDGHMRFQIAKELKKEKIYAVLANEEIKIGSVSMEQMISNWSRIDMPKEDKAELIVELVMGKDELSVTELAKELGITRQYVYQLLNLYYKKHPDKKEEIREHLQSQERQVERKKDSKREKLSERYDADDADSVKGIMQEDAKRTIDAVLKCYSPDAGEDVLEKGLEEIRRLRRIANLIEEKLKSKKSIATFESKKVIESKDESKEKS